MFKEGFGESHPFERVLEEDIGKLPVSIMTRDSSQLLTSSCITRASSCGLSTSAVLFSSTPDRGSLIPTLF